MMKRTRLLAMALAAGGALAATATADLRAVNAAFAR